MDFISFAEAKIMKHKAYSPQVYQTVHPHSINSTHKPDLNPIITLPQATCFAYMLMKNLEISRYFHYCQ